MKQIYAFCLTFFLTTFHTTLEADELLEETMPAQGQDFMHTFVLIGIALAFFYFILWRPEQKKRKAVEDARGSMKKGDEVTAMGIVGTVDRVEENTVILKMVDGSKIKFLKAAVSDVSSSGEKKD